jgi:2-keto-4-pentenoate hydratase
VTISDYAELKILDAVFNNLSFVVAQPYIKLHTADPGEAGTTAPAGNTTRQSASFGAAAAGAVANDVAITWTSVSTSETYSHVSVWDASSAGNCLWTGPLTTPKAVTAGDTFTIAIGQLTVALD